MKGFLIETAGQFLFVQTVLSRVPARRCKGADIVSVGCAVEQISQELIALLGTDQQIEPFSRRHPQFGLRDAYDIVDRVMVLRRTRGERPVGRKIGFTNRSIWRDHGISAPVWNYVFDVTVFRGISGGEPVELFGMPEPRIEPEIVLHLDSSPEAGMPTEELLECIDWVAPGFEVVYSIFPNWDFTAADAAAAYGVHGKLVIGEKLHLTGSRADRLTELSSFSVDLENNLGTRRQGHAWNVLGGPLEALRFLVDEIARFPASDPIKAGELVTTGTLTEAMPARPEETWTAGFRGIELTPLRIAFA